MAKIALELEQALARRAATGAAACHPTCRVLARGDGWAVQDLICASGPQDPIFEERHGDVTIAMVLAGTFQYRGSACQSFANGSSAKVRSANGVIRNELMTPGSLLLGNARHNFEVGHEHAAGDRCLSFQFAPEYFQRIASDAGVRKGERGFSMLRLLPLRELSSLTARARAGLEYSADTSWEELSIELANLFHLEAFLPFSEAVKLEKGNANVRPPSEKKKPFQDMLTTVEDDPASFHKKNRGITYLCEKFEFDNAKKRLLVSVPIMDETSNSNGSESDEDELLFGIADGGHTFEVIRQTMDRINELKEREGWIEPFVRVHFLAGESVFSTEVEEIVEALNTSSQVQQYTMDEYQSKFDELKKALSDAGFDTNLIAFRENEEKEWDIREIIQRMACFLKDRWKFTQPTSMYRSKGKALDLFTNDITQPEFEKLYGVIRDIITLPEFVQSQFSRGSATQGKRFGGLRAVKTLKKPHTRPGTSYTTDHLMDLGASLPIAAAFRELLELNGDRYVWKVRPEVVFGKCGDELYKVLASKSRTAKSVNSLGSDTELWTQAVNIILRTKDDVVSPPASNVRP